MPERSVVETFVERVEAGDFLGAIEQFYAPEATMQENLQPPRTGRDVLLEHERRVLEGVVSMRGIRLGPILVSCDQVAIRWRFLIRPVEGQARELDEVAWQTWRDGRIVAERFYYDPAQLAAEPGAVGP